DKVGGNWWLQVGGYYVGYWPSFIFTYLANSASSVQWGGEVFSPDVGQTSTQMGSGHFPNEGFRQASYIRNIQVVDSSNSLILPSDVGLIAPQNNSYDVQGGVYESNWGTYIYYGGPGN
uniref:Neprosin PEP catalytic domain-containing protein n=2 Tax=Aegilops tauschii subsp. strangulata TaxID=200361 RepID=A0A453MJI2_AEGTS